MYFINIHLNKILVKSRCGLYTNKTPRKMQGILFEIEPTISDSISLNYRGRNLHTNKFRK